MRRTLFFLFLSFITICTQTAIAAGCPASGTQVNNSLPTEVLAVVDSASIDTIVIEAPRPDSVAISQALSRSWRRLYPYRQATDSMKQYADSLPAALTGRQLRFEQAARAERQRLVDSLRAQINCIPFNRRQTRYQHDFRLPTMHTGGIPTWHEATIADELNSAEMHPDSVDALGLSQYPRTFTESVARDQKKRYYIYKSLEHHPRAWRFARRHFDVPGADRRSITNQKESLTSNRVTTESLNIGFGISEIETRLSAKADKWHWHGGHSLQMSQTAQTENWYKGGENSMALNSDQKFVVTRYDELKKTTFEMVLDLKLSAFYTRADSLHPLKVSDNQFTIDLKYGYKAWKRWYYSAEVYAKTPLFDYYKSNDTKVRSTFLSPLEVNTSLGMDFKYTSPKKAFAMSLMLAPASYNLKYVHDERVFAANRYGIDEGSTTLHQLGSTVTAKFDCKMGKVAQWTSRLYYFTSYESQVVEFENTLDFRISRYFSARLYYYPRFDDSADSNVQSKEVLTFGFSYAW